MHIKSDTPIFSNGTTSFLLLNTTYYIMLLVISLTLIAMSTNQLNADIIIISSLMIINIVIYNTLQTYQTTEVAQRIEDEGIGYILTEVPITGPIDIILSTITLLFLVTGNLFAWQMYLVYIVSGIIITEYHKKRLGVIPTEKKE